MKQQVSKGLAATAADVQLTDDVPAHLAQRRCAASARIHCCNVGYCGTARCKSPPAVDCNTCWGPSPLYQTQQKGRSHSLSKKAAPWHAGGTMAANARCLLL